MQPYLVVADLDGNGKKETLAGLPDGSLKLFTASGEQIWGTQLQGGVVGSPLVADLNGDGVQDILVALKSGSVLALNIWGNQQWALNLGQTIESTPLLADTDRDGRYELYTANLMSTNRDSGFFSQYKLSLKGGKALWPTLKGDPYRTGTTANAADFGAALNKGIDYATSWAPYNAGYRPRTGVQPPRRLRVTALPLDDVRGNHDGALDPGETAVFKVQVANTGKGASFDSLLTLDLGPSFLKLDRSRMYLGWIAPGATKTVVFRLTAPPIAEILRQMETDATFRDVAEEAPSGAGVRAVYARARRKQPARSQSIKLQVFEAGVQAAVAQSKVFNVPPLPPVLRVQRAYLIDKTTSLTSGNGNGRLDSGENVILRVLLRNDNLTTADKATATITSSSRDVLPITPTVPMKDIVPYGGRQIDFGLRIARELKDKKVSLTVTTYATAPKAGAVPKHSDTIVLPLGQQSLDKQSPEIAFRTPSSRLATVTGAAITIRGTVSDASGVSAFRFDKYAVATSRLKKVGAGRWSFEFKRELNIGENVFPVSATDGAGNSTTQWLRIVRRPLAPIASKTAKPVKVNKTAKKISF